MIKSINWYGMYTLYLKEVRRFLKVYNQTLIAPAVNSLMFLCIFVLALGNTKHMVKNVPFNEFMGCGLIIMAMVQNSFANSSSSLVMAKVIGYIIDVLIPPIGSFEIIVSYTLGAITRGILVGIVVTIMLMPFIEFHLHHPIALIFFALSACALLGMLGVFTGIASNSFDQSAAITSYIIAPLSFLSGTFYSIERLPDYLQKINVFNPFFYMIDGFRYSLTNYADSNIYIGGVYLTFINIALFFTLNKLLSLGWRIKT